MRYAIFFILLLTNLSLSAQTFTGKVKGKKGELLVGASVVASTESKSTVAYCLTSDKGEYRLNIPKGKNPASITVSYIGYQKKTMPLFSCRFPPRTGPKHCRCNSKNARS